MEIADTTPAVAPAAAPTTDQAAQPEQGPDLTKMSGREVREYLEKQKAEKETANKKPAPTSADPKEKVSNDTKEPLKDSPKEPAKKHKVKVNGEELEVDEEELKRGYSHQKAANKLLQEAKAQKKQAEEFINMLKDKDRLFDVIKKLGHDPRKVTEEYLAAQLQDELLDPRERELKEARNKLKAYEDLERQKEEKIKFQREEELKEKYAKEYNDQFVTALKESGLPPTKQTVADMAKYIHRSAKIGFKMSASEAAQLVREDLETKVKRVIGDADGESLIKILGEETANKLRQWDTGRLKNPEQILRQMTPEEQGKPREIKRPANSRMSHKAWKEFNRG